MPPRSNSLSSLLASVAFQAHMYPEGKQERDHELEWKRSVSEPLPCPSHCGEEPVGARHCRRQTTTHPLDPEQSRPNPGRCLLSSHPKHLRLPLPSPGQGWQGLAGRAESPQEKAKAVPILPSHPSAPALPAPLGSPGLSCRPSLKLSEGQQERC